MALSTSVFVATSVDGYIARLDGSIDWLMEANAAMPPGEDCGYAAFMRTVDVVIMGRHTYDQVAGFEPWPYEGVRVVVMTSRDLVLRAGPRIMIETSNAPPRALLASLATEGCQHAYVDGGQVIRSFLAEGLIDRLTITTIPILIGSGRPLFEPRSSDLALLLVSSKVYDFGFTQSTYVTDTKARPMATP